MNLQKTKLCTNKQEEKSISLSAYECIDYPTTGVGGTGHPRCLATLPNNIEELIYQFKMQQNGHSLVNQTDLNRA